MTVRSARTETMVFINNLVVDHGIFGRWLRVGKTGVGFGGVYSTFDGVLEFPQ